MTHDAEGPPNPPVTQGASAAVKEMTPRQRWLALLSGRRPDRITTDYRGTSEVTRRLLGELGCNSHEALWGRLHIDGQRGWGPRYLHAESPHGVGTDMWGIRYTNIDYGTGSYAEASHHPLAAMTRVDEVHRYRWPTPDDFDYTPIAEGLTCDDGHRAIAIGHYEPFLLYGYLRGLEQSYEDLILAPDFADAVLGHLFEFYYEHNKRMFEAAGKNTIDLFYLAEDLGSQNGPLISLEMYRRFIRPNQVKMADLVRSYGIHVFYHTDGSSRPFLNDLIDVVGIEILDPVQWRCPGMEREQLVRDFGGRVIFHGCMDNQQTMPFGTVEDVIAEVKENMRLFGNSPRGWICSPCHNLQPVTPTANILAMYETIHEIGLL